MNLTIIAAVAKNNVIGNKGEIPWSIPQDLKRFHNLTLGHPVIMGRVTYESILSRLGRPLEERTNIVVSESGKVEPKKGAIACKDIFYALDEVRKCGDIAYVIGGWRVYNQSILLPETTRLEITEVHKDFEGDAFFPFINKDIWKETQRQDYLKEPLPFSFVSYERIHE